MELLLSSAQWIWSPEYHQGEINATFVFEQELEWNGGSVRFAGFADSRYRLWINGEWVLDGPARGYADWGFYDEEDVTRYFHPGVNRVMFDVVHYGVDTFQYQRAEPGLIATFTCGDAVLAVTDDSWRVRRAIEWLQNVPRHCPQMGFEEHFDARIIPKGWQKAIVTPATERSLERRATGTLGKVPRALKAVTEVEPVVSVKRSWSVALRRYLSPSPLGSNVLGMAGVLAARLRCKEQAVVRLFLLGPTAGVFVDGASLDCRIDQDLKWSDIVLSPGMHVLTIAVCTEYDHATELAIGCDSDVPVEWVGPVPGCKQIWVGTGPLWTTDRDTNCRLDRQGPAESGKKEGALGGEFLRVKDALWKQVQNIATQPDFGRFQPVPVELFSISDAYFSLRTDRTASALVAAPANGTCQLFDLGEMTVGYLTLDIEAPAGTVVDAFCFEYIDGERIQYLHQYDGVSYRNSLRFVTQEGRQQFISRQRRGFRYVQLVCRGPARIYHIGVVESTHAPKERATFSCSDEQLNAIYNISQRTLLLCMEDAYTDCPTYEQVFWLDAARYASLFAQETFGADALSRHCWRLAAHSLEKLPMVASQCPSGWDVILPPLSFLWSIAVWETYWHTGSQDFLAELYPAFRSNLDTALRHCTDGGLFSATTWNFFDWAAIDQAHATVLHNSLLLTAVLDVGIRAATLLGHSADRDRFAAQRLLLLDAIEMLWDGTKGAYRDSRHADGKLSSGTSQHTSFLALLHDLAPADRRPQLLRNCLNPPPDMAIVGTPAAMFNLLEALRCNGHATEALDRLRAYWGRMLDAGATSFWEAVDSPAFWEQMHLPDDGFPTRSHCHGWAASPVYLLPRIFFGIEVRQPGWKEVVVRPNLHGLDNVQATICTPLGLLHLECHRNGSTCDLSVRAPAEMKVINLLSE